MHKLSLCGVSNMFLPARCFTLQYKERRMYHLLKPFALKSGFIFNRLLNIQVFTVIKKAVFCHVSSSAPCEPVALSVYKPVVGNLLVA